MVFRIDPKLPPSAFRTYSLKQPLRTHWRVATCAEVDCPRYLNGWKSQIDLSGQDGQNAAAWIRQSGLRFSEEVTAWQEITFTFPPGQLCPRSSPGHLARHRAPLDKPPLLVVRNGDYRQWTGEARLHTRPADWMEDLGEHLGNRAEDRRKG